MSVLHPRRARRSVVTGLALLLGTSLALVPAPAHAATPFVVIGTSDVSDSLLVAQVIEPRFEAENPQYDLQYIAKGTGAALTDARNGLAAAVIVHAASIENGFVGDGFSLEQYGRLVFWGDYVLLGPNDDPAGVAAAAPHDIALAFEKVAQAGAAGNASFVTRGGTPGTAVQEHAIWELTSGVPVCTVPTGNQGGGKRPTVMASDGISCGATADAQGTAPWPAWYHNGDAGSQAANVNIADTCPSGAFPNGHCYVFTDRGTYKALRSQGLAQGLKIVTRDNAATARGRQDALVNVFHAYGVNPAAVPPGSTKTDPVAAKLFLDFLTSATTQAAIGAHLAADGDMAFIPSAAPKLTGGFATETAKTGKKVKVTGNVSNVVPGYPALNGVTVKLLEAASSSPFSIPKVVATTTTDATGNYTFKEKLRSGKHYRVATDTISKVELPTLTPVFGSLITGTTRNVGTMGGVKITDVSTARAGRFTLKGKLKPDVEGTAARLLVYAAKAGGKFKKIGKVALKNGKRKFRYSDKLVPGTYKVMVVYENDGEILAVESKKKTVKLS